jgi:hypothetical protein
MDLCGTHIEPPVPTKRKPDLVITSLHAAKRVADREKNETWGSITASCARDQPHQHFEWFDILSSVELKRKGNIDSRRINLLFPPALSEEMPTPVPPQPDIHELFLSKKRVASSVSSMTLPSPKRLKILSM